MCQSEAAAEADAKQCMHLHALMAKEAIVMLDRQTRRRACGSLPMVEVVTVCTIAGLADSWHWASLFTWQPVV